MICCFNQTADDAAHLVSAFRALVMRCASETFLRALRSALQEWADEIQSNVTTLRSIEPADDYLEKSWPVF